MAAGAFSLVLVFLFICSASSEKFATGSTQTLSVNAERALKFIEWKHRGNLVVEWYSGSDPVQYRYRDHAKLNITTGELTIKMLKVYSGEYKCQYQYKDVGTFEEKIFQVEVIDPVSKPKVTCKKNATDITLTCTKGSSVPAEFTWTGPNGFSHVGNSVHITTQETNNSLYFCTAQNEVSKETAEFTLMNCYKGGNKGPTFLYWLIPLISILILILAVIAKRCYSKGDIPTNSNQEPGHDARMGYLQWCLISNNVFQQTLILFALFNHHILQIHTCALCNHLLPQHHLRLSQTVLQCQIHQSPW